MTSIIAVHNPIKLGIIVDLLLVVVAAAAMAASIVANRAVISSLLAIFSLSMLASTPIVFMLGCLGELFRTRVAKNNHGS